MAVIQVGAIVAAMRLARQAQQAIRSVNEDVRPLIARANAIAEEASRTVALATVQAQKIDRLVTRFITAGGSDRRRRPGGHHHARS